MRRANWLEWTALVISAATVLATVGYLAWSAATRSATPPDLRVSLGPVREVAGGYAVPVRVRNLGSRAAEAVEVEVVLREGGTGEVARVELEYLPAGSVRDGEVLFARDPERGTMVSLVRSYELP